MKNIELVYQLARLPLRRSSAVASVPMSRPRPPGSTYAAVKEPLRSETVATAPVFQTVLKAGIWHVTRDDRFYGDYLDPNDARKAVEKASASAELRRGTRPNGALTIRNAAAT